MNGSQIPAQPTAPKHIPALEANLESSQDGCPPGKYHRVTPKGRSPSDDRA